MGRIWSEFSRHPDTRALAARRQDILLFASRPSYCGLGPYSLSRLPWIVVNEFIAKICCPVKRTSVSICLESAGICIERTHEVAGTLLGGY